MSSTPVQLGLRANAAPVRAARRAECVRRGDGRARAQRPSARRRGGLRARLADGASSPSSSLSASPRRSRTSAPGGLADRVGRKRLLVIGWLLALPVPLLIAFAPNWGFIVAANLLLGAQPGARLVDDGGDEDRPRRPATTGTRARAERVGRLPRRRRSRRSPRERSQRASRHGRVVWVGAAARCRRRHAGLGLLRPGHRRHVARGAARPRRRHERRTLRQAFLRGTFAHPVLRACSQAGLVNNLNDALAWGLAPLYLAANGASVTEVGVVAAGLPGRLGRRPAR